MAATGRGLEVWIFSSWIKVKVLLFIWHSSGIKLNKQQKGAIAIKHKSYSSCLCCCFGRDFFYLALGNDDEKEPACTHVARKWLYLCCWPRWNAEGHSLRHLPNVGEVKMNVLKKKSLHMALSLFLLYKRPFSLKKKKQNALIERW
jgi:hypothetical protein